MGQYVSVLYSIVNMGTMLSARCGLAYPLHCLPLLRATWLVIMDDNAMTVAFVITNVIPNSIFAPIVPVGATEDIMVAESLKTNHPGLIPIPIIIPIPILLLIPTQIQIQIKIQYQIQIQILIQTQI